MYLSTKRCSKCRTVGGEFHKNKRQPDGFQNQCKACTAEAGRQDYEKHKRKRTSAGLERKYGISLDDYEQMSEDQDHACALCQEPEMVEGRRMAIDHDHETGRIRGLLCFKCNTSLGRVCDTQAALERLVAYVGGGESCQ